MNVPIRKPQSDALSAPDEIHQLHGEIIAAYKVNLPKAIRIGELLVTEKQRLAHGQWLPWLADNVSFSVMTAQRYMRIWEHREELKNNNVLFLSDAHRLCAPSKAADDYSEEAFARRGNHLTRFITRNWDLPIESLLNVVKAYLGISDDEWKEDGLWRCIGLISSMADDYQVTTQ